jgi:trans-aconitate methyltransferase
MKDFWDRIHTEGNRRYLTGTSGGEVLSDLRVSLERNSRVLNIGVGTGDCTREFLETTPHVDILDISSVALSKVPNARLRFLESELDFLPKSEYDFVLSHLVTQHTTDIYLRRQLNYVIPSLKSSGLFAMQVAFDKGEDMPSSEEERCEKGLMTRDLDEMKKLIGNLGEVVCNWEIPIHTSFKLGWLGLHIKRKE